MQDRVPTKPNRYAVYDDNHNFIRYEYHERADEPTQAGDALNKANLLPDDVAAALGLTGNPQVKDALDKLSGAVNPLQYVWDKYFWTETFSNGNYNAQTIIVQSSSPSISATIIYGDSFSYTYPNGPYVISNPTTIEISYNSASSYQNTLNGKYWHRADAKGQLYKGAGSLAGQQSGGPVYTLYMPAYQVIRATNQTYAGEAVSWEANTYPSDGIIGNYKYTFKGRPKYINVCISTGSYTGTGTYGSSNRNSITFNFAPKMIFILPDDANFTGRFFTMWINGMTYAGSRTDYVYPYQLHTNLSVNTFEFYGDRDAESQLNNSGTVYYYFAIG